MTLSCAMQTKKEIAACSKRADWQRFGMQDRATANCGRAQFSKSGRRPSSARLRSALARSEPRKHEVLQVSAATARFAITPTRLARYSALP